MIRPLRTCKPPPAADAAAVVPPPGVGNSVLCLFVGGASWSSNICSFSCAKTPVPLMRSASAGRTTGGRSDDAEAAVSPSPPLLPTLAFLPLPPLAAAAGSMDARLAVTL